jgi:hypothetical protein
MHAFEQHPQVGQHAQCTYIVRAYTLNYTRRLDDVRKQQRESARTAAAASRREELCREIRKVSRSSAEVVRGVAEDLAPHLRADSSPDDLPS